VEVRAHLFRGALVAGDPLGGSGRGTGRRTLRRTGGTS
jgi:hypothetical protein